MTTDDQSIRRDAEVSVAVKQGQKVAAIKLVVEKHGWSLKDAKTIIEAMMQEAGVAPPKSSPGKLLGTALILFVTAAVVLWLLGLIP